jgi:uncharacterized protein YndB with AHSA1/START domain
MSSPSTTSTVVTDRIEKQIRLRAPRTRVWQAIADARQFGTWFGVDFEGPFIAGATVRGVIAGTKVDPEIAKEQKAYVRKPFEFTIERIEPERIFSFRWHPYAVEENVDYSQEPTTLIVFSLEDIPEGTLLTVTESGFDRIPLERRAKAFTANDNGWTKVIGLLAKYLDQAGDVA